MKKPILNEEIKKMRKIMGLNENIFNTAQMGGVTNSKGTAGYIDNTSKMDKEYADSIRSNDDSNERYELDGKEVDIADMGLDGRMDGSWVASNLFWKGEDMDLSDEECERFSKKYPELIEKALESYEGPDVYEAIDPEEKMVSFDDLISQEDQAMIDAHDEEEANKYASKNYDDVESGAIDEDWGGSDQGYMNKTIHDSLNQPTEFSFGMFDDLKSAAGEAVDDYWSDWEEYKTDRDSLVMKAMRLYLRRYFPEWYENVSKMFS
jgi:hypothetical protein